MRTSFNYVVVLNHLDDRVDLFKLPTDVDVVKYLTAITVGKFKLIHNCEYAIYDYNPIEGLTITRYDPNLLEEEEDLKSIDYEKDY